MLQPMIISVSEDLDKNKKNVIKILNTNVTYKTDQESLKLSHCVCKFMEAHKLNTGFTDLM